MPRIGIAIPAYNCARYVEACILSALDQDIFDFKVFVVDDCSTDGTADIVRCLSRKFSDRVAFQLHDANKGIGATRQHAIDMALNDGCQFIVLLDGDDIRKPNSIEPQVRMLDSTPEAAVCYGRTDYINSHGESHNGTRWEHFAELLKGNPEGDVWAHLISRGKIGTMDTVVLRSEAASLCHHDPELPCFVDIDYLAQLATLPRNSKFIFYDGVVASYRLHSQQTPNRLPLNTYTQTSIAVKKIVARRVFNRLSSQGRTVGEPVRRKLWRMLITRCLLQAFRASQYAIARQLLLELIFPLQRAEKGSDVFLGIQSQ